MYDRIVKKMEESGVVKDRGQIITKSKALKKQFTTVVDHNKKSGNDRKTCQHQELCETIWGAWHSTRPLRVMGSMQLAALCNSASEENVVPSPSLCTSPSPCRPESSPNADGGQSGGGRQLFSLPTSKRTRRAHAGSLSDIREQLAELDQKMEERERLRVADNRERDDRIRHEMREERERQAAQLDRRFSDLNAMLGRVLERLSAPQPHHAQYPPTTVWRPEPQMPVPPAQHPPTYQNL